MNSGEVHVAPSMATTLFNPLEMRRLHDIESLLPDPIWEWGVCHLYICNCGCTADIH